MRRFARSGKNHQGFEQIGKSWNRCADEWKMLDAEENDNCIKPCAMARHQTSATSFSDTDIHVTVQNHNSGPHVLYWSAHSVYNILIECCDHAISTFIYTKVKYSLHILKLVCKISISAVWGTLLLCSWCANIVTHTQLSMARLIKTGLLVLPRCHRNVRYTIQQLPKLPWTTTL